ncbi:ECF RNA polymerase sigma factor SigE [bacterium HR15]|nr:ECF RNA polymerase sigma factor SigE [bacterium HR15]
MEERDLLKESEWYNEARRWFLQHERDANCIEDMIQDVLLRLLRCQQRQQAVTRAYLHRVCQSVKNDYLRRRKRKPATVSLEELGTEYAMDEMGYEQVEQRLMLEQALARLSERERLIVILHYLEGLSFSVIARQIGDGHSKENVKKTCQRAIKKLQNWVQSGGVISAVVYPLQTESCS